MHADLVAVLNRLDDFVDVGEVQFGVNTLRVQVHGNRHEVEVAGALTVAEQAPFDAVGTGHEAQLRRCDTRAAVIVRMQ